MLLGLAVMVTGCGQPSTPPPTGGDQSTPELGADPTVGATYPSDGPSPEETPATLTLPTPTPTQVATATPTNTVRPAAGTDGDSAADPRVVSSSASPGFEQAENRTEQHFVLRVDCVIRNEGSDGVVTVTATLSGEREASQSTSVAMGQNQEQTVSLVFDTPALLTGLVQFTCDAHG